MAISQQSFPETVAAFIQNAQGSRVTDRALDNVLQTFGQVYGPKSTLQTFRGFDETKFGKSFEVVIKLAVFPCFSLLLLINTRLVCFCIRGKRRT